MSDNEETISQDNVDNAENQGDTSELLTLDEVVEYEDQMIQDTAAVLGALNDKNCSYADGYIKRQALYSCLTCIPEAKEDQSKSAGVCLACSYHCHDGHELIELYTKRDFRCDCGNSKFSTKCNLYEMKDDTNASNAYNHNFQGTYCVCRRPYPDPEDTISDEMIQCIVCEDWYHSRHLGVQLPLDPFLEMVCLSCVKKNTFLMHYDNAILEAVEAEKQLDVDTEEKLEEKENIDIDMLCKKPKEKCDVFSTMFWPDTLWRRQLCACDACIAMYKDLKVIFLLNEEDPVSLYEEKGKAKAMKSVEEHNSKVMKSMDRVQLINAIDGYNELKENLQSYLKKFVETKKNVLTVDDVKTFFEEMQAKKKRKLDPSL